MKPSRAARYLLDGLMFLRNALRWMALNQRAWAALASSNARMAFSMWRYHTNRELKICSPCPWLAPRPNPRSSRP